MGLHGETGGSTGLALLWVLPGAAITVVELMKESPKRRTDAAVLAGEACQVLGARCTPKG